MELVVRLSDRLTKFKRPSDHSTFSPSSADRWMACPFSIGASSGVPDKPSKYAAEGTLAHKICEDYANHYFFEAEKTIELMEATDEQMHSAQGWVEVLSHWLTKRGDDIGRVVYFGLETGLPIYPDEGCFGTADAVIVGTKGCVVLDYKNGVGHVVGARSTQLQMYLLALHLNISLQSEEYKYSAVIFQPRVDDAPKETFYTVREMNEFNGVVIDAIEASKGTGLQPVLGSHCHWCKARTTTDPKKKCPAQKQKQIDFAGENFEGYLADINVPLGFQIEEMDTRRDKALIKIMALLPLMKSIADDAEIEFMERILRGEEINGVRVTDKLGNRQWAIEGEDLTAKLKEKYGIEGYYNPEPKLKTITQVEKEVGKKNFDNTLTKRESKKQISIDDLSVKEILGTMANYGQAIGSL